MAEAVFLVDIEADKGTVRRALTSHDGIVSWWTVDAEVSESDLSLGFPDAPARFAMHVDEASEEKVSWSSVGEFPPHWVDTAVTWQLSDHPSGSGTQLLFTHGGFPAPDMMLGHTSYTWAQLMGSLKAYAETGRANPFFS